MKTKRKREGEIVFADLKEDYRIWVREMLDIPARYSLLEDYLWTTPLSFNTEESLRDQNWVEKSAEMRVDFFSSLYKNNWSEYMSAANAFKHYMGSPNILEFFLVVTKVYYDLANDGEEEWASFFWELMDNIDFEMQDDENFDSKTVKKKLDVILNRKYTKTGRYGLFPLKTNEVRRGKDMRKESIGMQINYYSRENYRFL